MTSMRIHQLDGSQNEPFLETLLHTGNITMPLKMVRSPMIRIILYIKVPLVSESYVKNLLKNFKLLPHVISHGYSHSYFILSIQSTA